MFRHFVVAGLTVLSSVAVLPSGAGAQSSISISDTAMVVEPPASARPLSITQRYTVPRAARTSRGSGMRLLIDEQKPGASRAIIEMSDALPPASTRLAAGSMSITVTRLPVVNLPVN